MSTWLNLINELKSRLNEEYLTNTQHQMRDILCNYMQFPQWINLYGDNGTGKTFLAWATCRATGAVHVPIPQELFAMESKSASVIVDNAPYQEAEVRRILARCDLLAIDTVILVTRSKVVLPMKFVHLPFPTPDECSLIIRNISRLGYHCDRQKLGSNVNLWNVIQACL